jgi:hypothetical protein
MAIAMRPRAGRLPDRVPVMCQLALGHYFLQTGRGAVQIWHDTPAFGAALIDLQQRYRFDGILVNLPGRDPEWRRAIVSSEERDGSTIVHWRGGRVTIAPRDDNPHVYLHANARTLPHPPFDAVDPDRLFYVEPHDAAGITYPQTWGFEAAPAVPGPDFFPPWHWDTITYVRAHAPMASLHGEVFSPFTQLMELVGLSEGMLALALDPGKTKAILERLVDGAVALAVGHFAHGADAVLMSSAYAGAGFISKKHYEQFVLPYERTVIERVKARAPQKPVYTHTCGAIADRLELMEATGADGIDTLDPPPLGTIDLADAKARIGARLFIKGNIDPVNTVLRGSAEDCYRDALARIEIGAPGGGYILSTACSVPPHASPDNIASLARAADAAAAV